MEEENVPTTSASLMPMMLMMMYPTTVAFTPSGCFPHGSSVVDLNAEEPFVHVLEIMNLINVMIFN